MDVVLKARTQASLESMVSMLDVAQAQNLTDQQFVQLVHAVVLEGQFILETLNPTPVPDVLQENE